MRIFLPDLAETWRLGVFFAQHVSLPAVLLLRGNLGAGKTSFVQGLAKGLGIDEPVTSPTFALLHEYPSDRATLYHFDLYRLHGPDDVESLGFSEIVESPRSLVAIEWPERLEGTQPPAWEIELEHAEEGRWVTLTSPSGIVPDWLDGWSS